MAKKNLKYCPYCNEEINIHAKKCKHCGEWLEDNVNNTDSTIIETFSSRYEIIEEIGRGGMAIVYKAIQKSLDRIVALKVVPREYVHDKDFISRFKKEAKDVAVLNHRNIVTIYDSGEIMGYPFMAMEYLEGYSLRDMIQKKAPLDEDEIKKILIPILDGLQYAHEEGLIHRDIKSSNIMFDRKGRPVLMDFGIAKSSKDTDKTLIQAFKGTPEYASPEQAESNVTIDYRTDIYSLGIVAYEMATGKVPFKGDSPISVLHEVVHEEPVNILELNSKISQEFSEIINCAMSKDPNNRFQSSIDFSKAMELGHLFAENDKNDAEQDTYNFKIIKKKKTNSKVINKQYLLLALVGLLVIIMALAVYLSLNKTNDYRSGGGHNISTDYIRTEKTRSRAEALIQKARSYYELGNIIEPPGENAVELVEEIMKIEPNNKYLTELRKKIADELEKMGDSEMQRGQFYDARILYTKATNIYKTEIRTKKIELARKEFLKATSGDK